MMTEIKMKRDKIASGLTFSGPDEVIASWAKRIPKVLVYGENPTITADGIRFVQSKGNPIIKNMLGTYLYQIPGNEVLVMANPDVFIGGDHLKLLAYVSFQKMELAWACHCDIDGQPRAFVMAAGIVGHLMRDLPDKMTSTDPWIKWVHEWMVRMLPPHRYFDGTEYGIVSGFQQPVLNAYSIVPEAIQEPVALAEPPSLVMPVKRKAGRPKKA